MLDARTLSQAFVAAVGALRQAGIEMPELDARVLLCHAAHLSHEDYIVRGSERLSPGSSERFDAALARRLRREPVSRILGTREFYGREFVVGPETLDPRPDTETLVEAALGFAASRGGRDRPLEVLDLGTGTGCILVTLLAELPGAFGLGTDISEAAIALAAKNAARLGVAERASFLAADWLEAIEGRFDLIVCNPPYLSTGDMQRLADDVALYEPVPALYGGPDGLAPYRRIAAGASRVLAPAGRLLVEIGAGRIGAVGEIFAAWGIEIEEIRPDLAGHPRSILARAGVAGP